MKHDQRQLSAENAQIPDTQQVDGLLSRLGHSFGKDSESDESRISSLDAGSAVALVDGFEAADLGWFWMTDRRGYLTYISEKAADSLSKPADEMKGSLFCGLFKTGEQQGERDQSLRFVLAKQRMFTDITFRPNLPGKKQIGAS